MRIIKYVVLIVLLTAGIGANAQDFNVGVGFGYGINSAGGDGPVLQVEPGYQFSPVLRLGMRMEWSYLRKEIDGFATFPDAGDWSFTLNTQYEIEKGDLGLLMGVGGGLFRRGAISHPVAGHEQVNSHLHPGLYPRIGLTYGKFMLLAEYNIIPTSEEEVLFTELTVSEVKNIEVENSYFSIKAAFLIGK